MSAKGEGWLPSVGRGELWMSPQANWDLALGNSKGSVWKCWVKVQLRGYAKINWLLLKPGQVQKKKKKSHFKMCYMHPVIILLMGSPGVTGAEWLYWLLPLSVETKHCRQEAASRRGRGLFKWRVPRSGCVCQPGVLGCSQLYSQCIG